MSVILEINVNNAASENDIIDQGMRMVNLQRDYQPFFSLRDKFPIHETGSGEECADEITL